MWWNRLSHWIDSLSRTQRIDWTITLRMAITASAPNATPPPKFMASSPNLFPFYQLAELQHLTTQYGLATSPQTLLLQRVFDFSVLVPIFARQDRPEGFEITHLAVASKRVENAVEAALRTLRTTDSTLANILIGEFEATKINLTAALQIGDEMSLEVKRIMVKRTLEEALRARGS